MTTSETSRTSEQTPALVGQVLANSYEVVRLVGRGGMGTVFEGTNVRLGKRLAIKVLAPAADEESERRFRREAQITTEIGHPHIVDVFDFNETDDGQPYMVMEYLDGHDLESELEKQGTLPLERAAFIIRQVCAALDAAHKRSVIHRDLKPGNIFLCSNEAYPDFVKVLDFGISKVMGSTTLMTVENSLLGTPYYMAPEQAESAFDKIGPWSDVFAAGAIMYRMLSGELPFTANSLPSLLYRIVHDEPALLAAEDERIPPGVAAVLSKAMAKNPRSRYRSARDFSRDLLELIPAALGPEGRWEVTEPGRVAVPASPFGRTLADSDQRQPHRPSTLSEAASEVMYSQSVATEGGPRRASWPLIAAILVSVVGGIAVASWLGGSFSSDGGQLHAANSGGADGGLAPPVDVQSADVLVRAPPDVRPPPPDSGAAERHIWITIKGTRGAQVKDRDTKEILGKLPVRLRLERNKPRRLLIWRAGYRARKKKVQADSDRTIQVWLRRKKQVHKPHKPPSDMPGNPHEPHKKGKQHKKGNPHKRHKTAGH